MLGTHIATGLIPRLPTAALSMGLMLLAFANLGCGIVLDTVTLGRREIKRMRYHAIPAPDTPSHSCRPEA